MPKSKNLLFVFAHPDDEAFGPCGTLIKMSDQYDIHLLSVTRGQSGENNSDDRQSDLKQIREKELCASAKVVGAKSTSFLDFTDGELCNKNYHDIARDIQLHIDRLNPEIIMTWEPRGVTGHIDHIVVSMVCHYLFYANKKIKRLMLYCLSAHQSANFLDGYFIYRPQGYKPSEIDMVVDVSGVWDKKIEAIKCHKSQIKDLKKILDRPKVRLMEDCFLVIDQ
jgi:N-acetylglucosamine malate deacetylase 2